MECSETWQNGYDQTKSKKAKGQNGLCHLQAGPPFLPSCLNMLDIRPMPCHMINTLLEINWEE
jgi:hypothetical protein